MVVTCAIDHVKIQWQTILGFSQQRVNREWVLKGEEGCVLWISDHFIVSM